MAIIAAEDHQDAKRNRWMKWKAETLALVSAVPALSGHATASRGADSTDPSRFTYARLYCGPDGNSHFQDVPAELRATDFAPPAPPVHIGNDFPAARAFFGGFDARWGAQDLEKRLQTGQETAQKDFQQKQEDLYTPIIKKATDAVNAVAKEKGYAYVLDISKPTVVYFAGGDDLLPSVKTKLGIPATAAK